MKFVCAQQAMRIPSKEFQCYLKLVIGQNKVQRPTYKSFYNWKYLKKHIEKLATLRYNLVHALRERTFTDQP
jgi:hypothetical protein